MEDIDVICFAYIYGGYRCNLFCFTFMEDIDVIFVLFTFMEDIDVIFVYIYGGYRCNFCLHLWRISM